MNAPFLRWPQTLYKPAESISLSGPWPLVGSSPSQPLPVADEGAVAQRWVSLAQGCTATQGHDEN